MNAGPFTLLGAEPSILSLSWIHDALLMFTDINSVFCRYKPKLPIHFLLFYPVFDGVSSYYNRLPSEAFLVRTALPALDHINCYFKYDFNTSLFKMALQGKGFFGD